MDLLRKEIVRTYPDKISGVISMEGGMYLLISAFSGIAFLYEDITFKILVYLVYV